MDPNRAMSQYIRDHWGQEQGFPRGPVYAITQTPDGYLWIGTEAGLVRFDGWNFVLVDDPSRTFQITNVLGLEPAAGGGLWVRLQGATLLLYRNGRFESAPRTGSDASVTAMSRTAGGELLIAKNGGPILTFRGGYKSEKFAMLDSGGSLPRSPVLSLAQTQDGQLWVGTRDAGLFRSLNGEIVPIRSGLPDTKINCLLPDGDHGLWIGTDNGIVRWNGAELTRAGLPPDLDRFQALAMIRDRDGNLWVGTDSRGLLRLNGAGVASLNEKGEPSLAVTAVFEDREGNLWTGSASGLERLRDSPFVSYSTPEGLPTDGSNPVFVDQENRMWFAPVTGGLWWVKNGQHGSVTQAGLDKDIVYSIAGGDGELWLGRQRGGLTRFQWQSGAGDSTFRTRTYTSADGLAQNSVYSVYVSRDGTVWAGTLSGGVSRLKDGKFTTYTIAQGLASNTVVSILETSDGILWFATPNGLSALAKDRWISYAPRDGLPSENINCLFEDSAGVLWVGTSAGLAFRSSGQFHGIAAVPEQLREQIFGIAEDRYGSLWIATSNRVLRIDRGKLMRGYLAEGDIREFTIADGLRGSEGVKRQRSVVSDSLGRIWFSLNRGISVVDPARLNRDNAPVIVHIQSIAADNIPIAMDSSIRIPPGRRRVTFDFVGLNLSVPSRVRYRFKLDGFDRDWNGPVQRREAIYTNLDPGTYRFHVLASDSNGLWNGREATLGFEMAPAFWQTWWFRACVILACALAILAIYRLRLRQLTHQLNVRFEERLGERTRIAQDLHDTLLQGFLSASMQLHVAVNRLPPESPSRTSLNRVLQLMSQVIEEGRNAVRGLRSSQSASLNLENAFAQIQQELAIEDDVGFRVIVDGQPQPLHPLLRDEVYRIGREALVNAFQHSQAKSIEIEVEYAARRLRLLVRDNGRGIDPQTLQSGREGHWGLPGMRERAERIGATFHVWSRPSVGTEVELLVPSHLAFQSRSPHRTFRWFSRLYSGGSNRAAAASNRNETQLNEKER
ncbi:MAG TPA: two-component regulator propeller domain-containing protein [Bryobacteraceae bacterium]|nr:two-component regulator propeller domain-containing protein [Bryobacteraceae bacterium]